MEFLKPVQQAKRRACLKHISLPDSGFLRKAPPPTTIFSPVTSANVGLRPQNCLTLSFNPFAPLL